MGHGATDRPLTARELSSLEYRLGPEQWRRVQRASRRCERLDDPMLAAAAEHVEAGTARPGGWISVSLALNAIAIGLVLIGSDLVVLGAVLGFACVLGAVTIGHLALQSHRARHFHAAYADHAALQDLVRKGRT